MATSRRSGLAALFWFALLCVAPACAAAQAAQAAAGPAAVPGNGASPRPVLRVMFIGNSLTYVNNLPRLTAALAAAQSAGPTLETRSWVAPGGTIAQRWEDGGAAGALRGGHWDALVLQEQGGLLACMEDAEDRLSKDCRATLQAHREFATLATAAGARVLLFATWGPDEHWQRRLDEAIRKLARRLSAGGADVAIVPIGRTLHDWDAHAKDGEVFTDDIHPGVAASLVAAAQLYAAIAGRDAEARDMRIDFPLLAPDAPVRADAPMEAQAALSSGASPVLLKAEALAPYVDRARSSK